MRNAQQRMPTRSAAHGQGCVEAAASLQHRVTHLLVPVSRQREGEVATSCNLNGPHPPLPEALSLPPILMIGCETGGLHLSKSNRMMWPSSRRIPRSGGDCDASHSCWTHSELLAPSSPLAADCSAGISVHAAAEEADPAVPLEPRCQQRTVPSTPEVVSSHLSRHQTSIRECLSRLLFARSLHQPFVSRADQQRNSPPAYRQPSPAASTQVTMAAVASSTAAGATLLASLHIGNSHTPVRLAPSACPAGHPQLDARATTTVSVAPPDLLVPATPVQFRSVAVI